MNSEIHSAFINAVLADATYVNGLENGDQGSALQDKLRGRLTDPLAKYVGDNFRVVNQYTDPGSSGFTITVFQDRTSGQKQHRGQSRISFDRQALAVR